MARRWLALLMLTLLSTVVSAQEAVHAPAVIHLASEDWEDYTAADGHGLAWDVLRKVFEPVGVKVEIRSVPYTRSVGLVQLKEVDALVGSYRDEAEQVLYPHWNFDSDHIYALGLANNPAPTLATLGKYRLAWCAVIATKATCRTSNATTRSSAAPAFCRCSSRGGRITTSMR